MNRGLILKCKNNKHSVPLSVWPGDITALHYKHTTHAECVYVAAFSYFTLLSVCTSFNLHTEVKRLQNQPVILLLCLCVPVCLERDCWGSIVNVRMILFTMRALSFPFVQSSACCIFAKVTDELYLSFTKEHEALQTWVFRDTLEVFKGKIKGFEYNCLDFFCIIFFLLSFPELRISVESQTYFFYKETGQHQ